MTSFLLKISTFVFAVVAFASAVKFKYPPKEPCVIANFDATFDIEQVDTKKNITFDVSQSMTINGTCSNKTESSKLELTDEKEGVVLTFTFTKPDNESDPVTLLMTFQFTPNKINLTSNITEIYTSDKIELAVASKSWKCDAVLPVTFNGSKKFIVKSDFQKIQVQAFDVKGTFSPSDECPQDKPTTPTTKTTPPTTKTTPPTTKTTPPTTKHTTQTTKTTPPSTTPLPEPAHRFEVKDKNNDTCIIIDSSIELNILYETKDGKKKMSKGFGPPANASVSGNCTKDEAKMVLKFDDQMITLEFTDNGDAALAKVSMEIKPNNKQIFPDAKSPKKTMKFTMNSTLEKYSDKTYYHCNDDDVFTFGDNETTLTMKVDAMQAFNIKDNKVTGDGFLCVRDRSSTTSTPTTATPTTTTRKPAPAIPRNNFTVKDDKSDVCIYMQAGFQISVKYLNKKDVNVSRLIDIPVIKDSHVNGTCNKTSYWTAAQELDVTFNSNWSMHMVFVDTSTSSMLSAADKKFSLNDIKLTIAFNTDFFPDMNHSLFHDTLTAHVTNLTIFSAKGAYKCNSNQTLFKDENQLSLFSTDLMYKAFGENNKTDFGSDVTECAADEETNSTVPIAVGAALAALVIIVLIAYLIGRRRSRRSGYESV